MSDQGVAPPDNWRNDVAQALSLISGKLIFQYPHTDFEMGVLRQVIGRLENDAEARRNATVRDALDCPMCAGSGHVDDAKTGAFAHALRELAKGARLYLNEQSEFRRDQLFIDLDRADEVLRSI